MLLGVALLAIAASAGCYASGIFDAQELATVNARFAIRGRERPPSDIVVVGIDDVTFGELGLQWPFSRSIHATAIDRLRRAGASVIAYDVQFTEASAGPERPCAYIGADAPPADCALITATGRAHSLVFSTTEVDRHGGTRVLGGDEALRALGARAGNGIVASDLDGTTRRMSYADQGLKSFAVATVERAGRRSVNRARFPTDTTAWIDFSGPPGTVAELPLSRVLSGKFPRNYFRGKIVVVGAVAPTLKDVFHTSVSGSAVMSGPELQASAIETLRRGLPLRSAPSEIDLAAILLFGLLAPLASLRLTPLRALLLAFALGATFIVAAQISFNAGLVVGVLYPLVALIISGVGSLVVHYFTETRERRRTRLLFSRFVPENVVDEVLARADDDLRLGGVQRDGTVMFSDLRGFTGFAEALPVERVIEVLNRYLEEMSGAILDNGGTLVAYMGDGIMAVFGAPIEQEDHADRGLSAAREMLGPRLRRFNEWLRAEGLGDGFRMGIGLNSGHVMSGNVGSERRLEYTAIGDTTNTAARLEGMTKGTAHQIFIAEATRASLLRPAPDLVPLGEFDVRGRQRGITLFTLPEHEQPLPDTLFRESAATH